MVRSARECSEAISEKVGSEISHRQIDSQPLRMIGEHTVNVRLTVDMIPNIKVTVYREGGTPAEAIEEAIARTEAEATGEETVPELDEEATVPEGETSLESEVVEEIKDREIDPEEN